MADVFDTLVPEMASFMEDTSVEVDVEVGAPEAVEETADAAEETAEVAEVEAESEETEEAVEMVFSRMDELERMQAHIQKYGVSRDFMAWHNYDGRLAASLGITVPETESLDAIGDPNSALAIACVESIGEAIKSGAKKVWEFIKKVCSKIASFVGRIIEWIRLKVTNVNKSIGRLREAMKNREDDPEKAKATKAKFFTAKELNGKLNPFKGIIDQLKKAAEDIKKLVIDTLNTPNLISKGMNVRDIVSKIESTVGDTIKAAKKMVNQAKKDRPKAAEHTVKDLAWGDVSQILDNAAQAAAISDAMTSGAKLVKEAADALLQACNKAQQRGDEGADEAKKVAREAATKLSEVQSTYSSVLGYINWYANACVKSASVRITRASKKKGE